jgi:hypothetical protein
LLKKPFKARMNTLQQKIPTIDWKIEIAPKNCKDEKIYEI